MRNCWSKFHDQFGSGSGIILALAFFLAGATFLLLPEIPNEIAYGMFGLAAVALILGIIFWKSPS